MNITIDGNLAALIPTVSEIIPEAVEKAQVKAVNQVGGKIVKEARKIAKDKTGVPTKILKKRISLRGNSKATRARPRIVIFGGQWNVAVEDMSPAPRQLKSGKVKYKTLPGDTPDPSAFMYAFGSKPKVFRRTGPRRLPIKRITLDVSDAVKNAIAGYTGSGQAKKEFDDYFNKAFAREIRAGLRRKQVPVR